MMEEIGFNIEEIDIEVKNEPRTNEIIKIKRYNFLSQGGNTFYLLKAMRGCNFEKVIRKLLKRGARFMLDLLPESIVAGRTIKNS